MMGTGLSSYRCLERSLLSEHEPTYFPASVWSCFCPIIDRIISNIRYRQIASSFSGRHKKNFAYMSKTPQMNSTNLQRFKDVSIIRILAPALFVSAIASHAFAAGDQIEIAQFGPSQESFEEMDGKAAGDACRGKPVGAPCSYHSESSNTQADGKCDQLPPRVVGYGTKLPGLMSCSPSR